MMLRNKAAAATVAACVLATLPSGAIAGSNDPVDADVDVDVVVVGEIALERAASNPGTSGDRAEAQEAYLDQQARTGRLLDDNDVNAAVLDDATVVWDDAIDVQEVTIAATSDGQGEDADLEVGLETAMDDDAAIASAAATGLGLEVTSGLRGGTRISGSCVTTTVRKDVATTCFAKYKASYSSSSYNYYYYERWVTATGRPATTWEIAYTPAVVDIRSRPWKGSSAATHTKQLNDYWPRGGTVGCKEAGNASYSSAGMTMSVPLQECDATDPIPNATSKTMGVIYDQGSWVSGRTKTTSFGMTVGMTKGYAANMADYTYVKFCRPYVCLNQSSNIRKDSGW